MAKSNRFSSGDLVSGKKWNGEHFIGVYEHEYDCGDHCVFDGEKKYCVKHNSVKKATHEEEETIKETIIKPMREEKKRKALEAQKQQELEQEDVEILAAEPTDEEEEVEA